MSLFACCFWLFLLGVLIGWLLNWLLTRMTRKDAAVHSTLSTPTQFAAPVATARPAGIDVAAAAAVGISVKNEQDIIIIEGIGPKIKELFNQHGITTFKQIAGMSVAEMSAILDKGGSRFKLANPGSWAEQAKLAHENRWAELKALQDTLYAGVELTNDDTSNSADNNTGKNA
jgi:predicted flap endonuclease-1-like 5' DNA nuclease